MSSSDGAARRMAEAAAALLSSLDGRQRALASLPFPGDERFRWAYTPGPRGGLPLREMSPAQRLAAMRLLDAGLSAGGAATARQIVHHEAILYETERIEGRLGPDERDPELYYFTVFGEPGGRASWGWRVNGHHLALHLTVVEGEVASATPLFFGANPAVVHHGPERGLRILAPEEDLARALLASLDGPRRAAALVAPVAPSDILTRAERAADPAAPPRGVSGADLGGEQLSRLAALVRHYVGRADPEAGARTWARIERAGLQALSFAWAGPEAPGQGHYYAVTGPTCLIEYDNTQNGANHIHSVLRDLEGDWGGDVLAAHYAGSHRGGG